MTRIKICGITRVDDGLAAARAGADAIGLVFWPGTPRRVDAATARAIADAMPPFVTVVGLFVDPDAGEVRAVCDAVPLDLLQFHGSEAPALCRTFGKRYLKAFAVGDGVDLLKSTAGYDDAAGWIFDAHVPGDLPGGTGRTFDWSRLPRDLARPLVVSGGLDAANVGDAIARLRPHAVDVSSGVEARDAAGKVRRGIKDAARIVAFTRAVRDADDRNANAEP
jgi:phosphoribosylanthranilate isomerase